MPLTEKDKKTIIARLKRLGFKDVAWIGSTVHATHPKREWASITGPIRSLGFHVSAGGIAASAYACVDCRERQKAHEKEWAKTRP